MVSALSTTISRLYLPRHQGDFEAEKKSLIVIVQLIKNQERFICSKSAQSRKRATQKQIALS